MPEKLTVDEELGGLFERYGVAPPAPREVPSPDLKRVGRDEQPGPDLDSELNEFFNRYLPDRERVVPLAEAGPLIAQGRVEGIEDLGLASIGPYKPPAAGKAPVPAELRTGKPVQPFKPQAMGPQRAPVPRGTASPRAFVDLAPAHRAAAEEAQIEETAKFAEQESSISRLIGDFAAGAQAPLGVPGAPPPTRNFVEGVIGLQNRALGLVEDVAARGKLPTVPPQAKGLIEFQQGVLRGVADTVDFLLSPVGVATTTAIGAGPAFVRQLVGAGFSADMALRSWKSWKDFFADPSAAKAGQATAETAMVALPTAAEIARLPVSAGERKAIFDFRQRTVESYRGLRERFRGAPEVEVLPPETATEVPARPSAQDIVRRQTIEPGRPMSAKEARAAETTEQTYRRLFDLAEERARQRAAGRAPNREVRRRAVEPPETAQPAIEETARRLGISPEGLTAEDQSALVRLAEEEYGPGFTQVGAARSVAKPVQPVAETPQPAQVSGAPAPKVPDQVVRIPTSEIRADPVRFQFKRDVGEGGAGEELKEVQKFDRERGGVLLVWKDPADGGTYVVNGHHRLELARRTGTPDLDVRYTDAETAEGARLRGALMNIAEGRGTPVDAAKIFRDSVLTAAELRRSGVSLKGTVAHQGLALSNLDLPIFNQVVQGELPVARAVLIGEQLPEKADQRALVELLDKSPRSVTNEQLGELIRFVKAAPVETETQVSLFGAEEVKRSLALEKAEISAYVKERLGKERRLFAAVATPEKAAELEKVGNRIEAERNRAIAEKAAQAGEIYGKLSTTAGPIAEALEQGARDLAGGRKNANAIKERVFTQVRAEISKAFGGAVEGGPRGAREVPQRGNLPAGGRRADQPGPAPAREVIQTGVEAGKKRDLERLAKLAAPTPVDLSDAPKIAPEELQREGRAARLLTGKDRDVAFRPARGSNPPRIYLSEGAAEIAGKFIGTEIDGVALLPGHRVVLADALKKWTRALEAIEDPHEAPVAAQMAEIADKLVGALVRAPGAKVVTMVRTAGERVKTAIRHETVHAKQAELATGHGFNALGERLGDFLDHPKAQIARKRLGEKGKHYQEPAIAANEMAAYIGSGEAHLIGLHPAEAVELMAHYFDLLEAQHGANAQRVLDKFVPSLRRQILDARKARQQALEGPGLPAGAQPQPEAALRGVPEGREARARTPVQGALFARREKERDRQEGYDDAIARRSFRPPKLNGPAYERYNEGYKEGEAARERKHPPEPGNLFSAEALKQEAKLAGIEKARGDALTKSFDLPGPKMEKPKGPLFEEPQKSLFDEDEAPLFMERNDRGQFTVKQTRRDVVAEGAEYAARPGAFRAVVDFYRPVETRLREEGSAGKELMGKLAHARDIGEVAAGKRVVRLLDAGLAKLNHEQRTVELLDALEGRAEAASPEVAKAMAGIRGVTDEMGGEAKSADVQVRIRHRLKPGEPVPAEARLTARQEERRGRGERIAISYKRPFLSRENYYPHVIPSSEALRSGKIRADVIDNLVRQGVRKDKETAAAFLDSYRSFIDHGGRVRELEEHLVESGQATDVEDAYRLLSQFRKRSIKRQGSLEYSRQVDLPFYDPDPLRVLPPWAHSASLRLAQIREFGQDNQVLNKLIRQIEERPNAINVRQAVDRIIGMSQELDSATARFSRFVRMLQGFRLSLSFIPNATQGALNTLLKSKDLGAVLAGARGLATREGRRFAMQSGASLEGVISSMTRYAGAESQGLSKFLTATGFTATERSNRVYAANAGAFYARKMLERLKANPRDTRARHLLEEVGLDPEAMLKRGKIDGDDVLLAAKKFSDLTNFRAEPEVLPLFASSELGKVVFQFKNYIYGQTRLVYDETVTEIREGRPGEALKTLLLLAIAFPIAGEIIAAVRNAITGKERKDKGLERYFNDIAAAGTLGVFTDLIQAGKFERGVEFVAGPTMGEAGGIINKAAQENRARNLGRLFFARIPLVGPILVNRLFPPGTERQRTIRALYEAKGTPEFSQKARDAVAAGLVGDQDLATIRKAPKASEEIRQFRHLSIEEALGRFKDASAEEQKEMRPILRDKLVPYYERASGLPAQRREKINKLIREAFPR